jgi:hypothetical protein
MPTWSNDYNRYLAHLKSEYWTTHVHEAVKARCLRRNGEICCERCGTTGEVLQKHHLSYNWLYHELDNLDSILWVCEDCHRYLHKKSQYDPADTSLKALERRIKELGL